MVLPLPKKPLRRVTGRRVLSSVGMGILVRFHFRERQLTNGRRKGGKLGRKVRMPFFNVPVLPVLVKRSASRFTKTARQVDVLTLIEDLPGSNPHSFIGPLPIDVIPSYLYRKKFVPFY